MDPYNSADRLGAAPPPVPPADPRTNQPANPYAAPAAGVGDVRDDEAFVKSSRGVRLGATMLDGVFVAVPVMVLAILLPAQGGGPMSAAAGALLVLLALGFIAFLVVQVVLLHRHGQTAGKRLVGIRIVRTDGSRAGLGRVLVLRSFVPGLIGAIPLVGPFFGLLDPLFIFGQEKRCLHDLIADTIVVDA